MSRSTFSVLFYVNRGKEKNGIVPVMGRVTINGTQSQFNFVNRIGNIGHNNAPLTTRF